MSATLNQWEFRAAARSARLPEEDAITWALARSRYESTRRSLEPLVSDNFRPMPSWDRAGIATRLSWYEMQAWHQ